LHDEGKIGLDAALCTIWPKWEKRKDKKRHYDKEGSLRIQAGIGFAYIIFLPGGDEKKIGSLKSRFVRDENPVAI